MKKKFFQGNLGDLIDQISTWTKIKSRKNRTQNSFFNFY